MSLQHKYRPETFDEFFGNEAAVALVKELLERDLEDIPKAFLLVGSSGVGKTTLAYLIRDAYGGEDCDFLEIDGSKDRGIQKMRDMSESLEYVALAGEEAKKIILLDEVHGITHDAQEAILKTLENPPENSMLILCTTEPTKLKTTIRRRCKTITLKPLTMRDTIDLIDWVLESEDKDTKSIPTKVKKTIFTVSEGSPGIAMEIFDSVIGMENKNEEEMVNLIETMTFGVSSFNIIAPALIDWKANQDDQWKIIQEALQHVNTDFDGIRRKILGYLTTIMLDPKNKDHLPRLMHMADFFTDNFYDSGRGGLIMACYLAIYDE